MKKTTYSQKNQREIAVYNPSSLTGSSKSKLGRCLEFSNNPYYQSAV